MSPPHQCGRHLALPSAAQSESLRSGPARHSNRRPPSAAVKASQHAGRNKRGALRRVITERAHQDRGGAPFAPGRPNALRLLRPGGAQSESAHPRPDQRQANLTRRAGTLIGRSCAWPACVEPALCGLPDSRAPRVRDRTDFGSTDCQILARSLPHTPRDSNKCTACCLRLPCTMDIRRRKLGRTQPRRQTPPIRRLSIFSCCFPPHTCDYKIRYTPLARILAISHRDLHSSEPHGSRKNSLQNCRREGIWFARPPSHRSTHIAMPMPPPMHRVARPFLALRFSIS